MKTMKTMFLLTALIVTLIYPSLSNALEKEETTISINIDGEKVESTLFIELPEIERIVTGNTMKYAYSFEGYKAVLRIYNSYLSLCAYVFEIKNIVNNKSQLIASLNLSISRLTLQINSSRNDVLAMKSIVDSEREQHDIDIKNKRKTIIKASLITGSSCLGVGLIVGLILGAFAI